MGREVLPSRGDGKTCKVIRLGQDSGEGLELLEELQYLKLQRSFLELAFTGVAGAKLRKFAWTPEQFAQKLGGAQGHQGEKPKGCL